MRRIKYFISILILLTFIGCANNGTPSCEQQFELFKNCFTSQEKNVPCDSSLTQSEVVGKQIGEYCSKHLEPNFKDKCLDVFKSGFSEFVSTFLNKRIQRCLQ